MKDVSGMRFQFTRCYLSLRILFQTIKERKDPFKNNRCLEIIDRDKNNLYTRLFLLMHGKYRFSHYRYNILNMITAQNLQFCVFLSLNLNNFQVQGSACDRCLNRKESKAFLGYDYFT